jgi:threonine dehydratase
MAREQSPLDPLDPAAIRAALGTLDPAFAASPQFVHPGLSARAGRPVVVKVETVNPIRSFKGRGTWHAVRELVGEGQLGPDRPLVAASTGNFGQGIAYAGRAHGVPVTVFADVDANPLKLARIRAFGATVVQAGHDFDAAREASEEHARRTGARLLVDGEDRWIAGGAGTLALEVTDAVLAGALPGLGAAYVPVGNGALIVGVGAWLRWAVPVCQVIGIQSDAAPSMTRSWEAGRPIETDSAATFAEGIATRVPVPEALTMMVGRVDAMRLVSEADLRAAQAELTAELGITVEGAAAASWAGLLADPAPPPGAALLIVTGSNVAPGGARQAVA